MKNKVNLIFLLSFIFAMSVVAGPSWHIDWSEMEKGAPPSTESFNANRTMTAPQQVETTEQSTVLI